MHLTHRHLEGSNGQSQKVTHLSGDLLKGNPGVFAGIPPSALMTFYDYLIDNIIGKIPRMN